MKLIKKLIIVNFILLFIFSCKKENVISIEYKINYLINNISDEEVKMFKDIRFLTRSIDSSGFVINSFFKSIKDTLIEIPNFKYYELKDSNTLKEFDFKVIKDKCNYNSVIQIKEYSDSIFSIVKKIKYVYSINGLRNGIIYFNFNKNNGIYYIYETNVKEKNIILYTINNSRKVAKNWYTRK